MRKFMFALVVLVFCTCAFAQDKVEVFGGVQYRHTQISEYANVAGGQASATYLVTPNFGATVDFTGSYSGDKNAETFMVGPTLKFPALSFLQPQIHFLAGSERIAQGSFSDYGFTLATGGSIDINLNKHFSVRPINLDYTYSDHMGKGISGLRYSSGLVFRF